MRKNVAIIGLALLGFGSISYVVSGYLFEEAIGQYPTNYLPDEWKSETKRHATANYFGWIMTAAMPISLVGIPVTIHGFVQKFSVIMALIMGIFLLAGLAMFFLTVNPT